MVRSGTTRYYRQQQLRNGKLTEERNSYLRRTIYDNKTNENERKRTIYDNAIPFLDTLVIKDSEGRLTTIVYRKPTHTDQYLSYD